MISQIAQFCVSLVDPLALIWISLWVAVIWLVRRKQPQIAFWVAGAALCISLVGSTDLPGYLLRSMEKPYIGMNIDSLPVCDAVVTLGGSVQPSKYEAFGLDLTTSGDRIIMALELMRKEKGATLVIGGSGNEFEGQTFVEADMVGQWLAAWKIPAAPVISLGACENTHEEAGRVAALARQRGWQKIILVTSAYHMRRAEATFTKAGLNVVCAPCDFQTSISIQTKPAYSLVPHYHGFYKMSLYLHEQIGWQTYKRRGWL